MSIADLRKEYTQASLDEADALPNPFDFFNKWFDQALKSDLAEPNAMTLATVDSQGKPSARVVLIKGVDEQGFVFYTNYESRKGQEMQNNPHAAILFYWAELERQIRIEGVIEKVDPAMSDTYFKSRPLASQYGAMASPQSQVLNSRAELETKMAQLKVQYPEGPERPEHWGGYRLKPEYFEFWQGRRSRLHDRLCYKRNGSAWEKFRIAP